MNKTELKRIQEIELEILIEVDRICELNKLRYFLVGGTLLGAIRHKGFIPWDDDIDIAMPRKDYNRFIKIAPNSLSSMFFLQCNCTEKEYWLPYCKVRRNGTIFEEQINCSISNYHMGVFIDIFPLDNAFQQSNIIQSIQAKSIKKLNNIMFWKRGIFAKKKTLKIRILLFLLSMFNTSFINKFQQLIMSCNVFSFSKYFINLGSNYDYIKQTIPKDKFYPPIKLEFENHSFSAPRDYDYVLNRIYNNYWQLPPIEKRITHSPIRFEL